jgi:hypothetical protein
MELVIGPHHPSIAPLCASYDAGGSAIVMIRPRRLYWYTTIGNFKKTIEKQLKNNLKLRCDSL